MTAKVHRKCSHFSMSLNKCNLKNKNCKPWEDACPEYDLKEGFIYNFKGKQNG